MDSEAAALTEFCHGVGTTVLEEHYRRESQSRLRCRAGLESADAAFMSHDFGCEGMADMKWLASAAHLS
jgi:hypothetical protein